jgi:spore maturation protein CgeB
MHLVIFGLTISSSWGNGHATLWRGLLQAMTRRGHTATFYERDVPYYAGARDGWPVPEGLSVRLYDDFDSTRREFVKDTSDADVAIVTSYCPDGLAASDHILQSNALRVFYDLDTPVTLTALSHGAAPTYLPPCLSGFDLVLSYTGGRALEELRHQLGAHRVLPLYGWVDPSVHHPVPSISTFRNSLSYLGTFAADRQAGVEEFFLKPARALPSETFLLAGAQYPEGFPWSTNIRFARHLEPAQHAAFFCSSRATLNVTRRAMAAYGHCPSGRLFEAAACGTAVISDQWDGLDEFFSPGAEILLVQNSNDVIAALSLSDTELKRVGEAARERTLRDHTATARAIHLERLLEETRSTNTSVALSA